MTEVLDMAAFRAPAVTLNVEVDGLFRKGEFVVYPTHGVGSIERVGFEEVAGYKLNLIRISFNESKLTLRVPVAKARSIGLRRLASRKQLSEALLKLNGRPRPSRVMWAKRAQGYLAKINSGELMALAEAVRDLQVASDGSGSSYSQRTLFELALDRFTAEFAAINRITKADAVTHINQVLADARTHFKQTRDQQTPACDSGVFNVTSGTDPL
jgi:CarD family transcriptional regulator